jgi:hypothetical protein
MADNNDYNKVYEKLVETDKDYVGMLAYSIYKKQKQEYIKEYRLTHNGDRPNQEEVKNFHSLAIQPSQLEMYRKQAKDLTQGLTNAIINSKKTDIKDFIDGHLNKKGFWPYMFGVSQNLVANIIWLIIVGIVAFILWSLDHGPFEVLKEIINR